MTCDALSSEVDAAKAFLKGLRGHPRPTHQNGYITRIQANVVRAKMEGMHIGEECLLQNPDGGAAIRAEVIGMIGDEVLLAPSGDIDGLSTKAFVIKSGQAAQAPCGDDLLGRVIDPFGKPLDDGDPIAEFTDLHSTPPNAMRRPIIADPFETRVRVIDGLLTMGRGQRIGLFGAAGVGKSVLLSQIVRGAVADVVIVALIGERGREVAEFVEGNLGEEGLKKSCVIVSTAERPAAERLRAAYTATAAAEYFRDQGKSVLLLIDSATRVARAIREIGLAAGELPVRRGFPPSTFTRLPQLLERAGNNENGSITAIYTVLVEGDDDNADPVADEMRSLLDGHVILSRQLASRGQFPAIDALRSKSRVMDAVADKDHINAARSMMASMAKLEELELLLQVGEYQPGSDPEADQAIEKRDQIFNFLRQRPDEYADLAEAADGVKGMFA